MQIIPLKAIPSQVVNVVLGNQECDVSVKQRSTGVFISLKSGENQILKNTLCRDGVPVVIQQSRGFKGDLLFADMQGSQDPEWTDLGTRYKLVYIPE